MRSAKSMKGAQLQVKTVSLFIGQTAQVVKNRPNLPKNRRTKIGREGQ